MMCPDRKRALTKELLLSLALVSAGLLICAISLSELKAEHPKMAEGTPPLQSSPPSDNNAPAESKPGGTRPTTPAPEPARPNPQVQKEGAKAVLPPAPAEKVAPPIKDK